MSASTAGLNHYDKHKVICTGDEKSVAAKFCGGHTWNILNNSTQDEVYMRHCRNGDHFIDDRGNATSEWFELKRRVPRPDGSTFQDGRDMRASLECPPTAGREAAALRHRQVRQLTQITAPRDYASYASRRDNSHTPRTPGRAGCMERTHAFQNRTRDVPTKPTGRVLERSSWATRRGEALVPPLPPSELNMLSNVAQLSVEPHLDTVDFNLASELHARRSQTGASGSSSARTPRTSALKAAATLNSRCPFEQGLAAAGGMPRPVIREAHERSRHSTWRVEADHTRDITAWALSKETLKRGDHYFDKPVLQANSSCVKHDIITNERKHFWY